MYLDLLFLALWLAIKAYDIVPTIAKNVCIWGRHHRTKVDPGVAMPYFCALRAQKYGIFTRVNFCTMVTPPNANIFGTLSYDIFGCGRGAAGAARRARRAQIWGWEYLVVNYLAGNCN